MNKENKNETWERIFSFYKSWRLVQEEDDHHQQIQNAFQLQGNSAHRFCIGNQLVPTRGETIVMCIPIILMARYTDAK